MSFPMRPSDTTSSAPVEPAPPDVASYAPVPQATNTTTPRWSAWALVSAICGGFVAVGAAVAGFSATVAEILCVASGPALVGGLFGLVTISESNGRLKGRGLAVVGFVMGIVGIIVLERLTLSQLEAHFEQYPPFSFPSDD
ncbi:MAG TPA: DUF4190 domain-containing protein [Ktedonobacterales bacterium]|nr:DUF4190 domain-containing protein [Ktedonobacterales bacterium]